MCGHVVVSATHRFIVYMLTYDNVHKYNQAQRMASPLYSFMRNVYFGVPQGSVWITIIQSIHMTTMKSETNQ